MRHARGCALAVPRRKGARRTIVYGGYCGWKAAPIPDEIDRVLARHYGFSEEELDFIIHYGYQRMGGEAGEEGGVTGGKPWQVALPARAAMAAPCPRSERSGTRRR